MLSYKSLISSPSFKATTATMEMPSTSAAAGAAVVAGVIVHSACAEEPSRRAEAEAAPWRLQETHWVAEQVAWDPVTVRTASQHSCRARGPSLTPLMPPLPRPQFAAAPARQAGSSGGRVSSEEVGPGEAGKVSSGPFRLGLGEHEDALDAAFVAFCEEGSGLEGMARGGYRPPPALADDLQGGGPLCCVIGCSALLVGLRAYNLRVKCVPAVCCALSINP